MLDHGVPDCVTRVSFLYERCDWETLTYLWFLSFSRMDESRLPVGGGYGSNRIVAARLEMLSSRKLSIRSDSTYKMFLFQHKDFDYVAVIVIWDKC